MSHVTQSCDTEKVIKGSRISNIIMIYTSYIVVKTFLCFYSFLLIVFSRISYILLMAIKYI